MNSLFEEEEEEIIFKNIPEKKPFFFVKNDDLFSNVPSKEKKKKTTLFGEEDDDIFNQSAPNIIKNQEYSLFDNTEDPLAQKTPSLFGENRKEGDDLFSHVPSKEKKKKTSLFGEEEDKDPILQAPPKVPHRKIEIIKKKKSLFEDDDLFF